MSMMLPTLKLRHSREFKPTIPREGTLCVVHIAMRLFSFMELKYRTGLQTLVLRNGQCRRVVKDNHNVQEIMLRCSPIYLS